MSDAPRPDPERFLAEANAEAGVTTAAGRGRLKIFLGASPGVGKTYAMLEEAGARARAGTDVTVALAETLRQAAADIADGTAPQPVNDGHMSSAERDSAAVNANIMGALRRLREDGGQG